MFFSSSRVQSVFCRSFQLTTNARPPVVSPSFGTWQRILSTWWNASNVRPALTLPGDTLGVLVDGLQLNGFVSRFVQRAELALLAAFEADQRSRTPHPVDVPRVILVRRAHKRAPISDQLAKPVETHKPSAHVFRFELGLFLPSSRCVKKTSFKVWKIKSCVSSYSSYSVFFPQSNVRIRDVRAISRNSP